VNYEHQGAEVSTVVHDRGGRARCVPDRSVDAGNSRSLADAATCPPTSTRAGLRMAAYVPLSSRSRIRTLLGTLV